MNILHYSLIDLQFLRVNGRAAIANKEFSQLIKQAVPEIHEEGGEVRFGSFNRYKTLSFLLEFIDKTSEKVFVYKCKLSLSLALLYLVDLFIK